MVPLQWSARARSDIQRLHSFLAAKNRAAAARAVQAIRHGVKTIALQPAIGRPVTELEVQYREWPISFGDSGYIVRYRLVGGVAIVLAVRHQRESDF